MNDRLQEPGNTMQRQPQPEFDMDSFEDIIQTTGGNDERVTIEYEGYFYDSAFRLVKLKVDLRGFSQHSFDYLEDDVREAIALRINKNNIVLETKMEIV